MLTEKNIENRKEHNPNRSNSLSSIQNINNWQLKDPYEGKYQLLIKRCHIVGLKYCDDYEAAFTWSPIWKLTDKNIKILILPSGQVYLNV